MTQNTPPNSMGLSCRPDGEGRPQTVTDRGPSESASPLPTAAWTGEGPSRTAVDELPWHPAPRTSGTARDLRGATPHRPQQQPRGGAHPQGWDRGRIFAPKSWAQLRVRKG